MTMDSRSEVELKYVHQALANVIRGAAQDPQPFQVTYGIRTQAAEAQAVATGHSKTMHSLHLANADGVARAVDVTPLINGRLDFCVGKEQKIYSQVADQILASAKALGVDVMWGGAAIGAWVPGQTSHFRDWGHFQLNPAKYL